MKKFNLTSKIELVTQDEQMISGLLQDIVDNKIYVSIPADDKQFKILQVGEELKGYIYDKKKVVGFDAVISNRIPSEIPTYELSSLTNFVNMQRRQDVRITCSIPLLYSKNKYLLNVDDKNENADEVLKSISKYVARGIISDLSAGGLRISCFEDIDAGQTLLLIFELGGITMIAKGKVLHKELNIAPNKTTYIYGIKFKGMSESKREKIINHIFVLMRKNRLK